MVWAGIDYNLRSPAIGIWTDATYHVHFMTIVQKAVKPKLVYCTGYPYVTFLSQEERMDKISDWVMGILKSNSVHHVAIEDYSFGSTGSSMLQLAENTGLLKHKIYKQSLDLTLYAPKTIKKFATRNGNAGKFLMEEYFLKETNRELRKDLGGLLSENPVSDIVDAYYIGKLLRHEKTTAK